MGMPVTPLGDDLAVALVELREHAASRMLDTCSIRRVAGTTTDADGVVAPTYSEPIYSGPCRVQTSEPQERTAEVAGATVTTQRYSVHIPVGAYAPAIGDVVTIDTAALDPNLAGRIYRVSGLLHKQATAYRLAVVETP